MKLGRRKTEPETQPLEKTVPEPRPQLNQSELLQDLAARLGVPTRTAHAFLNELEDLVTEALHAGRTVSLTGFMKLKPAIRQARTGRNPRSGEKLQIPERRYVKIEPSKTLNEAATRQVDW